MAVWNDCLWSEDANISRKIFPHSKGAPASNPEDDRFAWMVEESKKLSAEIDVPEGTIIEIYKSSSDWEFILKIDALLEAAVRKVVAVSLANERVRQDDLEEFIEGLSMRGRSSLLKLLKAAGCAPEEIELIDCVRTLRNGFAHDITQMKLPLIDVIKSRKDKFRLLRGLSYIREYDETELIQMYEGEGGLLRFGIIHGTLTFLILAYHAIKEQLQHDQASGALQG